MKIQESASRRVRGYILLEALIALVTVGLVTFYIVNHDLLPGLRAKWDIQNSIIQNNWIH
jgi:hypothetical protein